MSGLPSTRRAFLGAVASSTALACWERSARADVPVTGPADPRLASFDRAMMSLLANFAVPGAALAVARHGRLVYARGFGHADVQAGTPVRPRSLFRIASISKTITSACIFKLVERGKLGLGDHLVDRLHVEHAGKRIAPADPRMRRITLRHLLEHRGGFDRDKSLDPTFSQKEISQKTGEPLPLNRNQIIAYMWRQRLDFEPGAQYHYSNFGYTLLGRVIEQASGQPYEAFAREHVLAPLGIHDMRIGRSLRDERARGEVCYYSRKGAKEDAVIGPRIGQPVDPPYGSEDIPLLDSHGGWIASAPDLVRFACGFDHPGKLLSAASLRTIFSPPAGPVGHLPDGKPRESYYACGWDVGRYGPGGALTTFHSGYLAGVVTMLVRRFDGVTWAILFNGDTLYRRGKALKDKDLTGEADRRMHGAADAVQSWPEQKDLFGPMGLEGK